MGFLIFFVMWTWNNPKIKSITPQILALVMFIGVAFIEFSQKNSSGSIFAHISGLINSVILLKEKPFGYGVGNMGVLAWLNNSLDVSFLKVAETGIGMISAQLDIIGIVIYIFFFSRLFMKTIKWRNIYCREKIMLQTLILAFLANAVFNEVALSPNSCGLYFVVIGVMERYVCIKENSVREVYHGTQQ